MDLMRLLIQGVIGGAILCGVISAMLRQKKVLALTGMLFALAATLLGGASVPINEELGTGPAIGLDWFLLDMLLMTLIFSPIEVLWPAYPKQSVFRAEWLHDIVYFLSTHLPIQVTSFLILLPATQLTRVLNLSFIPDSDGQPALAGAVPPRRSWSRTWRSTGFTALSTRCRHVALPRDPPFVQGAGLDRRLARSSGRRRRGARRHAHSDDAGVPARASSWPTCCS